MWLVYSDVHGPLWDITLRTRMNFPGTRADWLGRLLGFTTDERTGAARWDGIRKGKGRNELSTGPRWALHQQEVAGPLGQTNWISQRSL